MTSNIGGAGEQLPYEYKKRRVSEEDRTNHLKQRISAILARYVPVEVICPHCERSFELTEIKIEELIGELTETLTH